MSLKLVVAISFSLALSGCMVSRVSLCSAKPGAQVYLVRKAEWLKRHEWTDFERQLARYKVVGEYASADQCLPAYAGDYAYILVTRCAAGETPRESQELRPAGGEPNKYEVCR